MYKISWDSRESFCYIENGRKVYVWVDWINNKSVIIHRSTIKYWDFSENNRIKEEEKLLIINGILDYFGSRCYFDEEEMGNASNINNVNQFNKKLLIKRNGLNKLFVSAGKNDYTMNVKYCFYTNFYLLRMFFKRVLVYSSEIKYWEVIPENNRMPIDLNKRVEIETNLYQYFVKRRIKVEVVY